MVSGVEDPQESPVVLLQKVPRRFVFSLFSFRKKFLNIYSLTAIFLVTILQYHKILAEVHRSTIH